MMVGRLMLAVCLVCFCVSVAGAEPALVAKVRDLDPVGAGEAENPGCDGVATVVYHSGDDSSEISLVITGFLPEEIYSVWFFRLDEFGNRVWTVKEANAIITNPAGNGHWKTSKDGPLPYYSDGVVLYRDLNATFDLEDGEERAEGSVLE